MQQVFVCKPITKVNVNAQNKKLNFLYRYKDKILPKVPRPSDLFKDMMDNNREVIRVICCTILREIIIIAIIALIMVLQLLSF